MNKPEVNAVGFFFPWHEGIHCSSFLFKRKLMFPELHNSIIRWIKALHAKGKQYQLYFRFKRIFNSFIILVCERWTNTEKTEFCIWMIDLAQEVWLNRPYRKTEPGANTRFFRHTLTPFAFRGALILCGINSTRCWKHFLKKTSHSYLNHPFWCSVWTSTGHLDPNYTVSAMRVAD